MTRAFVRSPFQERPASSLRLRPLPDAAYKVSGSLGAVATALRVDATIPLSARLHVRPASVVLTTPKPSPAYTVAGSRGSIASSPVRPAPKGRQVRPPSDVRKTPFFHAEMYPVPGRLGSTITDPRLRAGGRPATRHVAPPSRVTCSPRSPTAQTVPARVGSTVSDQFPSSTRCQVAPPSVLRAMASRRDPLRPIVAYTIPGPAVCIPAPCRRKCHVAPASRERYRAEFLLA